jgi:predicted ArsR family transcriptional regulator
MEDNTTLQILSVLEEDPATISDISQKLGINANTAKKHLRTLIELNKVERLKNSKGTVSLYRVYDRKEVKS